MYISIYPPQTPTRSLTGPCARASNRMYDDVTYVYDDVTYVYDDVTYDMVAYLLQQGGARLAALTTTCVCVCVCVCVSYILYVCVYVYICVYTHTYSMF